MVMVFLSSFGFSQNTDNVTLKEFQEKTKILEDQVNYLKNNNTELNSKIDLHYKIIDSLKNEIIGLKAIAGVNNDSLKNFLSELKEINSGLSTYQEANHKKFIYLLVFIILLFAFSIIAIFILRKKFSSYLLMLNKTNDTIISKTDLLGQSVSKTNETFNSKTDLLNQSVNKTNELVISKENNLLALINSNESQMKAANTELNKFIQSANTRIDDLLSELNKSNEKFDKKNIAISNSIADLKQLVENNIEPLKTGISKINDDLNKLLQHYNSEISQLSSMISKTNEAVSKLSK